MIANTSSTSFNHPSINYEDILDVTLTEKDTALHLVDYMDSLSIPSFSISESFQKTGILDYHDDIPRTSGSR